MDTINLSKTPMGGYLRTINGASPRTCSGIKYDTDAVGVKLYTDTGKKLTLDYFAPIAWTIDGQSGFTTIEQVCSVLDVIRPKNFNGVCNASGNVVLSDTEEMRDPGYIEPLTKGGTIKLVDMLGNIITRDFTQNECSKFRVKQVFLTGTTADMGIVVYY